MKTGFLFVGQGQQYAKMGYDLAKQYPKVKAKYALAKDILGYDLLTLDEKLINETIYTQPALYVLGCVLDDLLKANKIAPDIVMGLSLGEYNALYSAQVISFTEGLMMIKERAVIMANADIAKSKMAAIINADEQLANVLFDLKVEVCNYNSSKQVVIGGLAADVDAALEVLKTKKYRVLPLAVSTVSHHPLLKFESAKLAKVLEDFEFKKPEVKFINNLEAKFQESNFVETLSRHLSEPTLFYQSVLLMLESGITTFYEVGPKGSLSRLVKSISKDVNVYNVYDQKTLGEVINGK